MSPRYQAIAQNLARSIQEGVLRPGERLPSVRNLCESEGVSLMTALAAHRWLESQGYVEALPRQGFRVMGPRQPALDRPPIPRERLGSFSNARAEVLAQVLASTSDPKLLPLGFGCPSPDFYPLASLRRLTAQLLNTQPELWAQYSPPPGQQELRRLIARRLQARGLDVGPDQILITTGGMEALSLALRLLLSPGDQVAVECPTFFGILNAARQAQARVLELPGDPLRGVDPQRFAASRHAPKAAVLIPSFANPTGSLMDEDRKAAWMQVLRERGAALVEDDLYGELGWLGRKPRPMAAFASGNQPWILVGSLSKTLLPGARVGYMAAHSPLIERLIELKSDSTLANATLPEHLALEALASGLFDRHLRRMVPRMQAGVRTLEAAVARFFPPGTKLSSPQGGFLLWAELPETDALSLLNRAQSQGVSLAPGCLFTLGNGLERFIRLNGAVSGDVEGAMRILGSLARGC